MRVTSRAGVHSRSKQNAKSIKTRSQPRKLPQPKRTVSTIAPSRRSPRHTSVSSPLSIPSSSSIVLPASKSRKTLYSSQSRHMSDDSRAELDPNIAYSNSNINSESALRRFYQKVSIDHDETLNGWVIKLNNYPARTPRNNVLVLPTQAYAAACALEYENQDKYIISHTMPLVEIARIALDRHPSERDDLIENIMNIFNCDSATHRVDPEEEPGLAAAQAKAFDPMIAWLNKEFGTDVQSTTDFWGIEQSEKTCQIISDYIYSLNPYQFIVLDNITALGKSAIVGLAFLHNQCNIEQTVRASLLEEYFQMKAAGHQIGDTYGTWLLDASARQRVGSHRAAMLLLGYKMNPQSWQN